MLARALVLIAFVMFFVGLVFKSVPAAVGGAVIACLASISAHNRQGDMKS